MFLSIKNVPKVSWSSNKPLNLNPKIQTLFFLCFGLILFGLGEGLLIVSAAGASPWSVFAQGIYLNTGFSIGGVAPIGYIKKPVGRNIRRVNQPENSGDTSSGLCVFPSVYEALHSHV